MEEVMVAHEENTQVVAEQKQTAVNPFSSGNNFQGAFDIAKMMASSSLVPRNYQGKPMDCLVAIDIANRKGLSPLMVMQSLYVVQGTPTWSGSACMSMIKASKEYKNVKPIYFGKKGTDEWGCYIQATEVDTGEIIKGTEITIKMAKDEGWMNKAGSKWKTMPEQMLAYRAAAFFARVYLPNLLMGASVEGEAEDIAKPEKKVNTIPNIFAENKKEVAEPTTEEQKDDIVDEIPEMFR